MHEAGTRLELRLIKTLSRGITLYPGEVVGIEVDGIGVIENRFI